jgi:hypothetical protein
MKTIGRITLMLVVVTVLMCSASGAHGQTISFVAAPAFPAGTSPTSVATGVLTGSGRPDVAVTNQHGVLILLNDGSGGMAPGNSYAAGTNPQSVVIDDFDGNGKNDLAVVNQGSGTVSIFLGNGDGSFVPGAAYAAGVNPRLVLTGDLNNDGKRDLVVVDSGAGPGTSGVSILLGNGDGSFRPASFVALGSVSISAIIGDFNGDGKADLAAANEGSDSISILLGNGDGTFQAPVSISLDQPGISVSPTSIVAADFNIDGKLDLAVATPNVHDVAVLLGNGNGTFGSPVHYALDDPNFVNNINKLASVDLNLDGYPDLVLDNLSSNHVTVLLNKGDGTFPSSSSYAAGPEPIGIAIADFNGGGWPDVIVADNAVDGEVTLLVNKGYGFQAAPLRRSGFAPTSFATGDFNGDGKLDLVTVSSVTPPPTGIGTGTVMLGNADGTFQAPKIWSTSAISAVAVGDFDGDGKLDLVETNPTPGNGNLSLLLGKGDGTFQSATNYTVGTTPETVAVADLNGDGKPDVIVGNRNSGNISVLLNAGNGSLIPAVDYATPATGTPESIAIGDFNGDGVPDIAVAISGINATSIAIFLNNGNGTFQPYISIPSGFFSSAIIHIVAADFDGDGDVDLAVTDGATLSVLLASGNAAFNTVTYLVGAGAAINGTLVVANFNGDQKPDLVTSSRDGLAVLMNTGDGGFQPPIPFAPFLGGAIAVGDFYGIDNTDVGNVGDGTPDIVAADSVQDSTTTDTIAVIVNQSMGPRVPVTVQTSPTALPLSVYYQFPPGGGPLSEFTPCTAPCTFNSYFGLWFQIYASSTIASSPGVQYALDHFSDNGFNTPDDSDGDIIHDVQVLAVPTTVTVYYKPQYQVTVVASPAQGGVVSPASGAFYDSGATVPLSAMGNPGYTFVQWTGVVTTTSGPSTVICSTAICYYSAFAGPTTWTAIFAPQTAALTSPAPGTTLSGSSVTFTWTNGAGATAYNLWLGLSGPGSSSLYTSGWLTTTSTTVTSLPAKGATVYARLYSMVSGKVEFNDYTYTEAAPAGTPATMVSPTGGSTLGASNQMFTWTAGVGATEYQLWLGLSGPGSSSLYASGWLTTTSTTVTSLPAKGATVYARLYSMVNGAVEYNDYTYTEAAPAGTPATMISPTGGSMLGTSNVKFMWTIGTGATEYNLWLGLNGPGSSSLYTSGWLTTTSTTVTSLPAKGATVYARLYSLVNGAVEYNDYTYTEQ